MHAALLTVWPFPNGLGLMSQLRLGPVRQDRSGLTHSGKVRWDFLRLLLQKFSLTVTFSSLQHTARVSLVLLTELPILSTA